MRVSSVHITMSSPRDAAGHKPTTPSASSQRLVDDLREHRLAFGEQRARRLADDRIVENRRKGSGQLPRLEERPPVDAVARFSARSTLLKHAPADERRNGRRIARPVRLECIGARRGERDELRSALAGVLRADRRVVVADLRDVRVRAGRRTAGS